MARFYATFDNSTVSSLEDASTTNRFQRKAFTNGSTLKTALVAARLALSNAMYNTTNAISLVNQNGSNGTVLPPNAIGNDGTTLSFTNVYTNPGAAWTNTPRVRPTEQILVGSSGTNPVSPTDGGSISASLYSDAVTALGNALAGIADGGPYGRLGLNQWRTLASLWHDGDLSYFAWDDFTPGQVQNITNPSNVVTGTSTPGATVDMTFSWDEEFPADLDCDIEFTVSFTNGTDTYGPFTFFAQGAAASATYTKSDITDPGIYTITGSARFRDPNIVTHFGTPQTFSFANAFTVVAT
jgi:hypothetical protein